MVGDCHSDFLKKGLLVPPRAFISGCQCPYLHLSVPRVQPRHPTLPPQALPPFGIQHCCLLPSSEFSGQSLTLWLLLEKEMATYFSILAWKIPWTGELGREQSMRSQRVGHDLATTLVSRESWQTAGSDHTWALALNCYPRGALGQHNPHCPLPASWLPS